MTLPPAEKWRPDTVARWVCVFFGAVLIGTMVGGAVATVASEDYLHTTETFTGGILLGLVLLWYGSRRPLDSVKLLNRITTRQDSTQSPKEDQK